MTTAVMGDFETAKFFCEVAMEIQEKKARSKYTEAMTLVNAHSSVLAWIQPLQTCLPPFQDAYFLGMKSGNSEPAMWSLVFHHLMVPFVMGKPLMPIVTDCRLGLNQIQEVQQKDQEVIFKLFLQMILNLTGQSEDTTRLEGDIFSREKFVSQSPVHDATMNFIQLTLYIFFGDMESAANLAIDSNGKYAKAAPGFFLNQMETFHRGVALYAFARQTQKRKYKKYAKKVLKTITKWNKAGNPNVKHYYLFLSAEQAALDKKFAIAEQFYKGKDLTLFFFVCNKSLPLVTILFLSWDRCYSLGGKNRLSASCCTFQRAIQ